MEGTDILIILLIVGAGFYIYSNGYLSGLSLPGMPSSPLEGAATGSEYPGLLIKKFQPDQDTLRNGESTEFNLVVENTGGANAGNIKAELFRAGELTIEPKGAIDLRSLLPQDESTGTPGQQREYAWKVTAPSIIKGSVGYNPGVRISYDYSSEGWSDLLATKKEQAKVEASMPSLRSGVTRAPVTVAVITPNALLYEGAAGSIVNIRVDVVNGASGIVYSKQGFAASDINKIKSLTIKVPAKYLKLDADVGVQNGEYWCCSKDCATMDDETKNDLSWKKSTDGDNLVLKKEATDAKISNSLELRRGLQKSFVCPFKVDQAAVGLEQIIPVQASSEYTYAIEAARQIMVVGS
jgi:hypothetical protein